MRSVYGLPERPEMCPVCLYHTASSLTERLRIASSSRGLHMHTKHHRVLAYVFQVKGFSCTSMSNQGAHRDRVWQIHFIFW